MTWNGATLYRSTDAGGSYSAFTSTTTSANIGVANGVLGDFGGGNVFDESNTVTVALQSGGTLTSYTDLQVLNGAGMFVLGAPGRWEILQYKVATLVGPSTYRLSGLLRGRRGTEWAMGLHAPGDRFVAADPNAWRRPNPGNSEIGLSRMYKGVTSRASLTSATGREFTNTAAGLKPYAPVHIGGGSDADGNLTINWVRRSRIDGGWRDNVDVPLGEASEAYEVDIMDASFTTVKRTIRGLTSPTAIYSAADQAADGIAPTDPIYVQVYQMSPTVGRGFGAKAKLRTVGGVVSGGGSGGGESGGGSGGGGGTGTGTVVPVPTGIANGSTVTLNRDTIYQGTLNLSGKTGVNVVAAAGSGAAPVITPGKAITGWTVHSGSIYKAAVDFIPVQVSISDVRVKRASWPVNVPPWATSTAGMPSTDVIGATLYRLVNQSVIQSSVLSSNSVPTSVPFYIEGKLWMLTSAGAWVYDSGFLYVWAPDGATPEGRAWATPAQPGINADNSSGVSITGVNVISASVGVSGAGSTNLHVTGGSLKNLSTDGIYAASSTGLVVDGTAITNARENGVNAFYGSNNVTVKNSNISSTGMVGNPCPSLGGIFIGGPNTGTLVQNNSVTNSAYHGISVNANANSTVSGNTVDGFCKIMTDGGGIYTQSPNRAALVLNMTISGNTVKNGTGSQVMGIYLDDGSNGVTVTGNTLTNNTVGLMLHDAFNNTVEYNNFTKSVVQHVLFANAGSGNSTTFGNIVRFNTMAINNGEYAYNLDRGSSFSGWAAWSNNAYTSNNTAKFGRSWDGVSAGIDRSYSQWLSLVGETGSTMNGA